MAYYNQYANYHINQLIIRYNDNRLEKGDRTATIHYSAYVSPNYWTNESEELYGDDVDIALTRFIMQENKDRKQLYYERKLYIYDMEEERKRARRNKRKGMTQAVWRPRMTEFDKVREEMKEERRKVRNIVLGTVSTIIIIGAIGYIIDRTSHKYVAHVPATNPPVSYNVDNHIARYVRYKVDYLYNGVYAKNNRASINREEAYHYCMYVANLIATGSYIEGDNFAYDPSVYASIISNVGKVMQDSNRPSFEDNLLIQNLAETYHVSKNRIAYSATPDEVRQFRNFSADEKREIIERFVEVAEKINFEFRNSVGNNGSVAKSDCPKWWTDKKYNHDKIMEVAKDYLKNISVSKK